MTSKSKYNCSSRWHYPLLMRLVFMTVLVSYSYLCFAQDSLQVDTNIQNSQVNLQDSIVEDSEPTTSEDRVLKKKKKSRKIKKSVPKDQQHIINEKTNQDDPFFGMDIKYILLWFSLSVIILFFIVRAILDKIYKIRDSDGTVYLSRRDYYRNVYLKSEAWQRKRFVVLKRDNWKCVYCGQKATEVHHKRYARINIGSEPIEWLVSICSSCHDSLH